jgi:muconolactone delta-isomerase
MIRHHSDEGLDAVITGHFDNEPIFTESDGEEIKMILEGITPRKFQKDTYADIRLLGAVISPDNIRRNNSNLDEIGI